MACYIHTNRNKSGEKWLNIVRKNAQKGALLAFGSKIRAIRLGKDGLQIKSLADNTGVSERTLSRLENTGICSTSALLEVFQHLGVLEDFFSWLDNIAPLPPDKTPKRGRKTPVKAGVNDNTT